MKERLWGLSMGDIYTGFKDNDGWVFLRRAIQEEIDNYKNRLTSLAKDPETTKDPIQFTIKSVELSSRIKAYEQLLMLPEEILKPIEDKKQ